MILENKQSLSPCSWIPQTFVVAFSDTWNMRTVLCDRIMATCHSAKALEALNSLKAFRSCQQRGTSLSLVSPRRKRLIQWLVLGYVSFMFRMFCKICVQRFDKNCCSTLRNLANLSNLLPSQTYPIIPNLSYLIYLINLCISLTISISIFCLYLYLSM